MVSETRLGRLCSGHWSRALGAGLVGALGVTLLFAVFGPAHPLAATLLHSFLYATCISALAGAVVPRLVPRLASRPPALRWLLVAAAFLGLAVIGTAIAGVIITASSFSREAFWTRFASDVRISLLVALTLGVGMTLYETLRARLEAAERELRARELEQERTRKLAVQARLSSLEARLHPHFLFNTLNAISALIQEDPERAERIVERLAELLRFSLDAGERGVVPLAEELRIAAGYLEIEAARLGDRLSYALDVDPDVGGWEVPPLSVQTLVENSVKHAVSLRRAGGRIHVEARRAGDRLLLAVWDDGPGFSPDAIVPGHGLDNLETRLAVRFGPGAALQIAPHDGGTRVSLSLPGPAAAPSA